MNAVNYFWTLDVIKARAFRTCRMYNRLYEHSRLHNRFDGLGNEHV